MEIVCEGTLEDCVKWYFDVNFCENAETMWGNEEGFMVEDFDRYMDMTVQQFKNSQVCKDTVHLGYAPCLSSDFKARLKVLKIGDVSEQKWRATAVRVAAQNEPVIDDEPEPATNDLYDSRYGHHAKCPPLNADDCTFGVKACRKVNRDEVVVGIQDIGHGVALETDDCITYLVAKNDSMQFVITNIEDMHIDQNEVIAYNDGNWDSENSHWFGDVVVVAGEVAESILSNKGSTSIAKIMDVPVATIHGGFQGSGILTTTAANLTKTTQLFDRNADAFDDSIGVIIRPMAGSSYNAATYQWGHNSDQNNTLHDMANFDERVFKKMVSNLMKGGKNAGDAHGYQYLRFFGTTIDAKSFKEFAITLNGAKSNDSVVSLRIYNAHYDGESSGHYGGHRLSIVGSNWSADFFNQTNHNSVLPIGEHQVFDASNIFFEDC